MFLLRNKKNNFQVRTLIRGPGAHIHVQEPVYLLGKIWLQEKILFMMAYEIFTTGAFLYGFNPLFSNGFFLLV